jgi:hypothetical protein
LDQLNNLLCSNSLAYILQLALAAAGVDEADVAGRPVGQPKLYLVTCILQEDGEVGEDSER